jgi:hypothetical protein
MQMINGDWSGVWKTFVEIVARVLTAYDKIIQSLLTITVNWLKMIGVEILNYGKEIWNAGVNLASQLIQGFINGIASGQGGVFGAIGGMVSGLVQRAKDGLIIRSPSQVFFGIGAMVGLGFALGVASMQATAAGAIDKLTSAGSLNRLATPTLTA